MQKENGKDIKMSFPQVVGGNLPLSGLLLKEEKQPCFRQKVEDPQQKLLGMTNFFDNGNNAFTLIELLVVVLIIGILAAVALPQYEKSVWKSRASNMQTYVRSVATAQRAYVLANGEQQPAELDELAVSLDGFTTGTKLGGNTTALTAYNDLFEIRVGPSGVVAYFISGKYKGCGLGLNTATNEWRCQEWHAYYKGEEGGFCQKIMKAGELLGDANNVRRYAM